MAARKRDSTNSFSSTPTTKNPRNRVPNFNTQVSIIGVADYEQEQDMETEAAFEAILMDDFKGDHWTLTVVDPDNDIVYFMDPVRRRIPGGDWVKIVKAAMVMANADRKKKGRNSVIPKYMAGIPFQLGNTKCGFYVMRYMREIIEDKDTLRGRREAVAYTVETTFDVRDEWADFVVKNYVQKP